MEDRQIIDLYWSRSEEAISQTDKKYGPYCYKIAYNILGSKEDSEESVYDTYMDAWNAMPPNRPTHLACFLGKITRRRLPFAQFTACFRVVYACRFFGQSITLL